MPLSQWHIAYHPLLCVTISILNDKITPLLLQKELLQFVICSSVKEIYVPYHAGSMSLVEHVMLRTNY